MEEYPHPGREGGGGGSGEGRERVGREEIKGGVKRKEDSDVHIYKAAYT